MGNCDESLGSFREKVNEYKENPQMILEQFRLCGYKDKFGHELVTNVAFTALEELTGGGIKDGLKLNIINQTGYKMDICCGEKEYVLNPDETIPVEVNDEDCMYIDAVRPKEEADA